MLNPSWATCNQGKNWCPLGSVKMNNEKDFGVYVIFTQDQFKNRITRYVGQGEIWGNILRHRRNANYNGTLITWAVVSENDVDDCEAYLIKVMNPLDNIQRPPHRFGGHTIKPPY